MINRSILKKHSNEEGTKWERKMGRAEVTNWNHGISLLRCRKPDFLDSSEIRLWTVPIENGKRDKCARHQHTHTEQVEKGGRNRKRTNERKKEKLSTRISNKRTQMWNQVRWTDKWYRKGSQHSLKLFSVREKMVKTLENAETSIFVAKSNIRMCGRLTNRWMKIIITFQIK